MLYGKLPYNVKSYHMAHMVSFYCYMVSYHITLSYVKLLLLYGKLPYGNLPYNIIIC